MLGSTYRLFSACYSVLGGGKTALNVFNSLSSEHDLSIALVTPCERFDCIR